MNEISADPAAFVSLMGKKKLYFFNGYEIPNNQSIYISERFSSLAQFMFARSPLYVPFGVVAPFALFGMILGIRRWQRYSSLYLIFIFSRERQTPTRLCTQIKFPHRDG